MNTYTCYYEDCQKNFNSKYNLIRHINSYHLDNKSYMCSFCNKGFYNKQSLSSHVSAKLCIKHKKSTGRGIISDLAYITEPNFVPYITPPLLHIPTLPRIEVDRQVPMKMAKLPIISCIFHECRKEVTQIVQPITFR